MGVLPDASKNGESFSQGYRLPEGEYQRMLPVGQSSFVSQVLDRRRSLG